MDDCKHVIFGDETKINMFNSDGRLWCWIGDKKSSTCPSDCECGNGSVMIW